MNKPRCFGHSLSWWLGETKSIDRELMETLGIERPPPPSWWKRPYKRVRLIYRRAQGVRPTPVRNARRVWQRGTRGYALEDTWSLDTYLSRLIPRALDDLWEGAHGCPVGVCGCPVDDYTWEPTCDHDQMEEWRKILTKIADGHRAHTAIMELDYYDRGDTKENNDARHAVLQATFEEGMALMTLWWGGLWN